MNADEYKVALSKVKETNVQFIKDRAVQKRKVTIILGNLKQLSDESALSPSFLNEQIEVIEQCLNNIIIYDTKILQSYEQCGIDDIDDEAVQSEHTAQIKYQFQTKLSVNEISKQFLEAPPVNSTLNQESIDRSNVTSIDNEMLKLLLANNNKTEVKPPSLQCRSFDGSESDKLEFRNFLEQFNNVIDCKTNMTDASKLIYLRGYLRGYAFKVVQHLSVCDQNYAIAIKLLKEEFLDVNFIVDELLKKILTMKPKNEFNNNDTRIYINEIRAILYELSKFDYDFMQVGSPGCLFVSHVIYSKLPVHFRREISRKTCNNYPDVNLIFEHYNEIISNLQRNMPAVSSKYQSGKPYMPVMHKPNDKPYMPEMHKPKKYEPNFGSNSSSSLQNYKTNTVKYANHSGTNFIQKPCKFCGVSGHSLVKCTRFTTANARIDRCRQLKLCIYCSSAKHTDDNCTGLKNELPFSCQLCSSKAHIAALCLNQPSSSETLSAVCLNYSQESAKPFILPTVTLKIGRGKNTAFVRCLIDSGSQRSYLSKSVFDKLNCDPNSLTPAAFTIKTFIGDQDRVLNETMLEIHLANCHKIELPILIDDKMSLMFEVNNLNLALKNIVDGGLILADSGFDLNKNNDTVILDALLGTDVIQFFNNFNQVRCLNGSAFQFNEGVIPFGHVDHFLKPGEIVPYVFPQPVPTTVHTVDQFFPNNTIAKPTINNDANDILTKFSCQVNPTVVNFILDPISTYFSPLSHVLEDSDVEHGLEQLFRIESLGLKDTDNDLSTIDQLQMDKFKNSIELKDGRYYVELPWYTDKIKSVPSNYKVALSVLNRVYNSLESQNLTEAYHNIFKQQLDDGVIERINVAPENFNNYVFIPHRPIIKQQLQVTTKIRIILNCSLKTNSQYSLNEAAYPGIDLMSSLVGLLIYFRSNKYAMLSDVKAAFLQIKLKLESDKNKFCVFWKENNELIVYRYNTIVFGFTSSPFILNYVIKHHADNYPDDEY